MLSEAISDLAWLMASECATLRFMRSKAAAFEPSPEAMRASLALPFDAGGVEIYAVAALFFTRINK